MDVHYSNIFRVDQNAKYDHFGQTYCKFAKKRHPS